MVCIIFGNVLTSNTKKYEVIVTNQTATQLETQLRELHKGFQNLAGEQDSVHSLISMIHKPGWTTIAEVALVTGIVDAMLAHTKALNDLKQALLSGASKVSLNPQPLPPAE
jgi:ABC-type thiamin/hydroxymethylpyrimidine transport system permease subunit